MKFFKLFILSWLLVGGALASYDAGLVTTSDYLRFPVIAVNDTGLVVVADSGHIVCTFEGEATANTFSYSDGWATAGSTGEARMDSQIVRGYNHYFFLDQIADIDNGEGEGNYSGSVILFADGQPFYNDFSFILYDEESEALYDRLATIAADIVNIDAWDPILDNDSLVVDQSSLEDMTVATVTTLTNTVTLAPGQFTKIKDSVTAFLNNYDPATDSVLMANISELVDFVWNESWATVYTAGSIGDSLTTAAYVQGAASALTKELIAVEVWTISGPDDSTYTAGTMGKDAEGWDLTGASGGVDSTVLSNVLKRVIFGIAVGTGSDSLTLAQRKVLVEDMAATVEQSIYAEFISGSNEDQFKANVSALALEASLFDGDLSTLATAANLTLAIDSINAILDTLQNQDGWVATAANQTLIIDTVNATIDTLQNQDGWIATQASLTIAIDSINAILDTLQLQDGWVATSANQTLIIDTVNGIIDTIQIFSSLTHEMQADVDSLLLFDGYCTDCRAIAGPGATTDTMHVYNGATRMFRLLYWHVGGSTGDSPDSTTVLDN